VSEPKALKSAATLKPVPYRHSKVMMLLQPHFSNATQWNLDGKKTTTVVTTMLMAYPGHRDYAKKRPLLNGLELLLGSDIAKRTKHSANTGLGTPKHLDAGATRDEAFEGSDEETSSLEMSNEEEEEEQVPRARRKFPFQLPPVPPVIPSAPTQSYNVA